jgi:hypothetical protein
MQEVIKQYIRDEKGNPRGVVVALRKDDEINYGFSLCNPEDLYSKDQGMKIALARANAEAYQLPNVPDRLDSVLKAYEDLESRALKYFKDLDYNQIALGGGFRIED